MTVADPAYASASARGSAPCVAPRKAPVSCGAAAGKTCAVILAGGSGERFGDPRGKQFVDLAGMPVVCWSLRAFDQAPCIDHLVVVAPVGRTDEIRGLISDNLALRCPVDFAEAGATRQESVAHGMACVPASCDVVAIHDGARPLIEPAVIERTVAAVRGDATLAGAIAANPTTDTLKICEDATIVTTPDRSFYWSAQTPQVFWKRQLASAHRAALEEGYLGTDDASLVEHRGGRVLCVDSPRDNVKITLPEDLAIARALLELRGAGAQGESPQAGGPQDAGPRGAAGPQAAEGSCGGGQPDVGRDQGGLSC